VKYQEEMYDFYLDDFVKMCKEEGGARPFMREFREFSCAVALRSFLGTYITEEQVKVISDNYYRVTEALELVNFPWILPYTKAWYGKKIADMTMKIFEKGAQMSKDNMAAGGQVTCVCDDWMKMIHDSKAGSDNVDASVKSLLVRDYSNQEISEVFFAFLFAAQDATSSACTWLYQLVADRPDVMKKIREEQLAVRQGDLTRKLDLDLIDKMEYTNMVIKEALRYRPPVPMVPYEVKKPFPISPEYTVPKGAMIVPTLYPALHDPEVYDSPEEFIPDRWTPNSKASIAHKNWLVFGHGPHVCIGKLYIMYHLTAMIGKSALFYDWKHTVTPTSENIRVFATIFPEDDCLLNFTKREDPTLIE
jgi:C-22 sterol desaturase